MRAYEKYTHSGFILFEIPPIDIYIEGLETRAMA
jgi:hypothetical protein